MSVPVPPTRSYDLTSLSDPLYRNWLRSKWRSTLATLGFMAFAGSVFVVYSVIDALPHGFSGRSEADLVLAVFFFAAAYLLYFVGNARSRQPATAIEVRPDSLVVAYGPTRRHILRWNDPSFRMQIGRFKSATLGFSVSHVLFWTYPRLFLTDEASDALVSAAKSRGLLVESVKDPYAESGTHILIRRVSAAA